MRILLIGATGTIGSAIAAALRGRHDVLEVSHKKTALTVDLADPESIRAMYKKVGKVDAVVSAAGSAKFAPLEKLSDDDFRFSLNNKLMGQVNVVRFGFDFVNDGGSLTVTSGVLAQQPMKGSGAVSLVNSGLEGFTRAAALEAPRNIRVNCVSPPWVSETLKAMGQDPSSGVPAEVVARSYVRSIEGRESGLVIAVGK
jgi:NAD(P)-dependent dehydrogenase (short-subunit alcohol dehydrogenase family)